MPEPMLEEQLLILTKTYPLPSREYRETSCVAAVAKNGELRRLYPVPFRLLDGAQQFKKWEWIGARVQKAWKDHRPESYKLLEGTIQRTGKQIDTKDEWQKRLQWIAPHIFSDPDKLESHRQESNQTLGFIRPKRLLGLDITPLKNSEWTAEELSTLTSDELFDSEEVKNRAPLRKVPYNFHYRYTCDTADGEREFRHMVTDWEVGALYWNCRRGAGSDWESKLRAKLEGEFSKKDLVFLLGTVHRFPDQWLIVGLYYPPRTGSGNQAQLGLEI